MTRPYDWKTTLRDLPWWLRLRVYAELWFVPAALRTGYRAIGTLPPMSRSQIELVYESER